MWFGTQPRFSRRVGVHLRLHGAHLFLQGPLGLLLLLQLLLQAALLVLQLPQTRVQRQLLPRLLLQHFLRGHSLGLTSAWDAEACRNPITHVPARPAAATPRMTSPCWLWWTSLRLRSAARWRYPARSEGETETAFTSRKTPALHRKMSK